MFKFYSPQGQLVKTSNLRDFAVQHSLPYSHVKDLNCGRFKRYKGWLSTHASARKYRKRFLTALVNEKGKRHILGQTVTGFAKSYGLCLSEVSKLVNGHKLMYRGWCLEKTLQLAQGHVADAHFQK
jgi:hypothetical protein